MTRLPETFPLAVLGVDQAFNRQYRLLECIAAHLEETQLFEADSGCVPGHSRSRTTGRVKAVLADFLVAQDAALLQGAGTRCTAPTPRQ